MGCLAHREGAEPRLLDRPLLLSAPAARREILPLWSIPDLKVPVLRRRAVPGPPTYVLSPPIRTPPPMPPENTLVKGGESGDSSALRAVFRLNSQPSIRPPLRMYYCKGGTGSTMAKLEAI